jgi:ribose transport system permease protein
VTSSLLASCAGVLLASKLSTATPDLGPAYLLPAFAAAFLGTTQIKPGKFNVLGTLLAIFLLATGVKGLQLAGAADWVTDLFNGLALIIAVGLSLWGARLLELTRTRKGVSP